MQNTIENTDHSAVETTLNLWAMHHAARYSVQGLLGRARNGPVLKGLIPALLILFLAKWLVEFVSIWEILFRYKKMLHAGIIRFDAGIIAKIVKN